MTGTSEETAMPAGPRWDPLVRLTHWGIAAAVLLNGLVIEEGGAIHVWIGYAALAMLALRLVWGLAGTGPARFSAFPPSLSAARAHLSDMLSGRHRVHRSHNPLGALMVYALWAMLAVVTATGIAMAGSPLAPRPGDEAGYGRAAVVAGHDEAAEEHGGAESAAGEALEEVHEVAANLLLLLAAMHVGGVALESRLSGRNLVRPMLKGS
ncbi:hypothetical protein LNKW23_37440 [Paralimibaculum aggregatum]|uniref:Cytochrome b561 bacterial/Ni-hydrogenase domain-containing protein n=1 Tax=Paralimibaculum aggregatum TaxID=3036245 RepID=A0ABQ6LMW5_9RHOB|nr:cytochrome b/b6 domain-containing protein [Limibaculum sp. NKW23]GMG84528.1 hypothetical protein LNKW23_37440 [Limibaculum sp. NKW23]